MRAEPPIAYALLQTSDFEIDRHNLSNNRLVIPVWITCSEALLRMSLNHVLLHLQ